MIRNDGVSHFWHFLNIQFPAIAKHLGNVLGITLDYYHTNFQLGF